MAPNAADRLAGDPTLQWHPNARPLRDLHAAGKLTVLPAVGYTDPNQSHFTSRHYWEVGELNPSGRVGWMGRYLDRHGIADNPLQGLALDYSLAPSLAPASCRSPPWAPRELRLLDPRSLGRRRQREAAAPLRRRSVTCRRQTPSWPPRAPAPRMSSTCARG